jgi:hypothetical protein
MDDINPKHDVMFVTTDDSESGKKFKEKLDELNGYNMAYSTMPVTGYGRSGNGSGSGSGLGAITIDGSPAMANGSYSMRLNYVPMKMHSFKAMPKGAFKIMGDSIMMNGEPVIFESGPDSVMVVNGHGDKSKLRTMVYTYKNHPYTNKAWSTYTQKFNGKPVKVYGWNSDTSIDHLSSKMIIIDGKEATGRDLKKLSAADIESMSVKSGEEQTKKYGDKAKNGVLYITTKK